MNRTTELVMLIGESMTAFYVLSTFIIMAVKIVNKKQCVYSGCLSSVNGHSITSPTILLVAEHKTKYFNGV